MFRYLLVILTSFCFLSYGSVLLGAGSAVTGSKNPPQHQIETKAYTPKPGSSERKEIMDALRQQVREMSGLEVVFVVSYLKVKNGWAWAETMPQSADGKNHYESVNGLLKKVNGKWSYVEGPPEWAVCEEDPNCSDTSKYFKKLRERYPSAPTDIFPVK